MKKTGWLSVAIMLLLLVSLVACDPWSSYLEDDQYGHNEYDGDLTWEQVSSSNSWAGRYKHASTVFDGRLWIFGGYGYQGLGSDSYLEDVWYSSDGETWTCATMDAPWNGRTGHAVVTLGDWMYLIGGYAVDEDGESTEDTDHYMNDVWKSDDGENWEQVCEEADFGERAYHGAIVVGDKIYVIGGRKDGTYYYDDIWESGDGKTWTEVSLTDEETEDLGERAGMAVATDGSDIYIQGGYTADYQLAEVDQGDWKKIRRFSPTDSTLEVLSRPGGSYYDNRALMGMVPYDDHLYLFSGVDLKREYNMDYSSLYSTWVYTLPDDSDSDGSWEMDSSGSGFGPRHGYAAEVFDDKIWILGGWAYTGAKNDVWTAELEDQE
jgi:N-acetylneuraminic acid mutarotase